MTEPRTNSAPTMDAGSPRNGPPQASYARRSLRVAIDMPVEVTGQCVDGTDFRQDTRTRLVSAHGALLVVATKSEVQPSIFVRNGKTGMEAKCRVVYQKRVEAGKAELGVEFVDPQPRFWGISFPPDDWSRAERKIPTFPMK